MSQLCPWSSVDNLTVNTIVDILEKKSVFTKPPTNTVRMLNWVITEVVFTFHQQIWDHSCARGESLFKAESPTKSHFQVQTTMCRVTLTSARQGCRLYIGVHPHQQRLCCMLHGLHCALAQAHDRAQHSQCTIATVQHGVHPHKQQLYKCTSASASRELLSTVCFAGTTHAKYISILHSRANTRWFNTRVNVLLTVSCPVLQPSMQAHGNYR